VNIMVEMLKIKIQENLKKIIEFNLPNSLNPNSKFGDLLDRCYVAGKRFLKTVERHHPIVSPGLREYLLIVSFRLFHCNLRFNCRDPDIFEGGARLIARLAKKYPEMNDILKLDLEMSEEEIVQVLQTIQVTQD
jgi:hypothetical protein